MRRWSIGGTLCELFEGEEMEWTGGQIVERREEGREKEEDDSSRAGNGSSRRSRVCGHASQKRAEGRPD